MSVENEKLFEVLKCVDEQPTTFDPRPKHINRVRECLGADAIPIAQIEAPAWRQGENTLCYDYTIRDNIPPHIKRFCKSHEATEKMNLLEEGVTSTQWEQKIEKVEKLETPLLDGYIVTIVFKNLEDNSEHPFTFFWRWTGTANPNGSTPEKGWHSPFWGEGRDFKAAWMPSSQVYLGIRRSIGFDLRVYRNKLWNFVRPESIHDIENIPLAEQRVGLGTDVTGTLLQDLINENFISQTGVNSIALSRQGMGTLFAYNREGFPAAFSNPVPPVGSGYPKSRIGIERETLVFDRGSKMWVGDTDFGKRVFQAAATRRRRAIGLSAEATGRIEIKNDKDIIYKTIPEAIDDHVTIESKAREGVTVGRRRYSVTLPDYGVILFRNDPSRDHSCGRDALQKPICARSSGSYHLNMTFPATQWDNRNRDGWQLFLTNLARLYQWWHPIYIATAGSASDWGSARLHLSATVKPGASFIQAGPDRGIIDIRNARMPNSVPDQINWINRDIAAGGKDYGTGGDRGDARARPLNWVSSGRAESGYSSDSGFEFRIFDLESVKNLQSRASLITLFAERAYQMAQRGETIPDPRADQDWHKLMWRVMEICEGGGGSTTPRCPREITRSGRTVEEFDGGSDTWIQRKEQQKYVDLLGLGDLIKPRQKSRAKYFGTKISDHLWKKHKDGYFVKQLKATKPKTHLVTEQKWKPFLETWETANNLGEEYRRRINDPADPITREEANLELDAKFKELNVFKFSRGGGYE